MIVTLYIPAPGKLTWIAAGSAIAGRAGPDADRIHCYYEGNLYRAENLQAYRERACVAAGRMRDRAPTIAQASFQREDLRRVAEYDLDRLAIVEPFDLPALQEWSGEDQEALIGRTLPEGPIDRGDAGLARLIRDLRPDGRTRWRTTAGQILDLRSDGALVIAN